jgi:hypothetical protein
LPQQLGTVLVRLIVGPTAVVTIIWGGVKIRVIVVVVAFFTETTFLIA